MGRKQSALTMSRLQQFCSKPQHHKNNSSDVDKSAESHWQYNHEQSDKVKVYDMAMTVLSRVSKQLRVYDCSYDCQQVIT